MRRTHASSYLLAASWMRSGSTFVGQYPGPRSADSPARHARTLSGQYAHAGSSYFMPGLRVGGSLAATEGRQGDHLRSPPPGGIQLPEGNIGLRTTLKARL